MRTMRYILASGLAAALLLAAPVPAADQPDPASIPGSKARQLLLKQALRKHASGTLVSELNRNKQLWQSMTAEQLRELRDRYNAFRQVDPERAAKLLEAEEAFSRLSDEQKRLYEERAVWLKPVIDSLTPAQREELKSMTPEDRARRLLELKSQLPTSQPTTRPTTRPATAPSPIH